jgi:hypothetical protein
MFLDSLTSASLHRGSQALSLKAFPLRCAVVDYIIGLIKKMYRILKTIFFKELTLDNIDIVKNLYLVAYGLV